MFGIKIIRESDFNHMKKQVEQSEKYEQELNKQVRYNQHFRDQINAYIAKEKAVDKLITSSLTQYHVIRENNYPCDKCNTESKGCKKLMFADRTICVCPKCEIVSFRSKNKGAKKPDPKI